MSVSTWDEIRTAFHVARMGTVSGAADALGVHHATVIRHVDALEERLGVKLFQRHARGYTATEAGRDLLQVAQATDDQFTQLVGRIKGRGEEVTGEMVVTSLPSLSRKLTPLLTRFQAMHPGLIVRYISDDRILRLEYGEAHVAIRAGAAPEEPDNVVQPFVPQTVGLYAAQSYADRRGVPGDMDTFVTHDFIGFDGPSRVPFENWLRSAVPPERIVFRVTSETAMYHAIASGAGIGFMTDWEAKLTPDLVAVEGPWGPWSAPNWLVTHVDLHRTTKVQTFLKFLKEEAADW